MRLHLTIGTRFDTAPSFGATAADAALLAAHLPLPVQLHTPKFAGSHIYQDAPCAEDVEGGSMFWQQQCQRRSKSRPMGGAKVCHLGDRELLLGDGARLGTRASRIAGVYQGALA